MKSKPFFLALAALAFILAACSGAASTPASPTIVVSGSAPTAAPLDETLPTRVPTPAGVVAGQGLARADSQGMVEFVITPLNLATPGETLSFDVSMNTHSVDLSWDLAAQSVLSTDTGLEVRGLSWPASNGHHVEGTLSFPAKTSDGKSLLEGAKKLTLTIKDAGAPQRLFEWEISQ
jgi:hypothetical protein